MKLLELLARAWVVVSWLVMLLVAAAVCVVLWMLLRPLLVEPPRRRGIAPSVVNQRDLGDETQDIATEGLGIEQPAVVVRDGILLSLGELHPNDQDVFGPARRAP